MSTEQTIKRACIVGWPVNHSRSPMIYGYWLRQHSIVGEYVKEAVKPEHIDVFLSDIGGRGYVGCNVTVPHKVAAFRAIKVKSPAAVACGSANLLWLENGVVHGNNTDTYGFMTNLTSTVPDWQRPGAAALVLGSGGSTRTILYGLLDAGVTQIRLSNRTRAKAQVLASEFDPAGKKITVVDWDDRSAASKDAAVVINATSLGMSGVGSPSVDFRGADKRTVVADLVYIPLETEFLASARREGLRTVDGLGMLLHQAVPSFEAYWGLRPTVTPDLRALIITDMAK
jgi:shikimate dehydrogenase